MDNIHHHTETARNEGIVAQRIKGNGAAGIVAAFQTTIFIPNFYRVVAGAEFQIGHKTAGQSRIVYCRRGVVYQCAIGVFNQYVQIRSAQPQLVDTGNAQHTRAFKHKAGTIHNGLIINDISTRLLVHMRTRVFFIAEVAIAKIPGIKKAADAAGGDIVGKFNTCSTASADIIHRKTVGRAAFRCNVKAHREGIFLFDKQHRGADFYRQFKRIGNEGRTANPDTTVGFIGRLEHQLAGLPGQAGRQAVDGKNFHGTQRQAGRRGAVYGMYRRSGFGHPERDVFAVGLSGGTVRNLRQVNGICREIGRKVGATTGAAGLGKNAGAEGRQKT